MPIPLSIVPPNLSALGPPDISGGLNLPLALNNMIGFANARRNQDSLDRRFQMSQALQQHMRDMMEYRAQNPSSNIPLNVDPNIREIPSKFPIFGSTGIGSNINDLLNTITDPTQRAKLALQMQGLNLKGQDISGKHQLGEEKLEQTGDIAGGKLANAQARTAAYAYDKMNPNYLKYAQPGGNLLMINPKDPSDVIDTGYDSGLATQDQIFADRLSNAQQIEAARQSNRMQLQRLKGQQQQANISSAGEQTRETQAARPETPSNMIRQQVYNAHNYLLNHPEIQGVQFDQQTGMPDTSKSNMTQQQKDEFNQAIGARTPTFSNTPGGNIISITKTGGGTNNNNENNNEDDEDQYSGQ